MALAGFFYGIWAMPVRRERPSGIGRAALITVIGCPRGRSASQERFTGHAPSRPGLAASAQQPTAMLQSKIISDVARPLALARVKAAGWK
jgi:hypothetical protein